MSPSERLRENIKKYRTEARLLAVDPTSFEDESDEADGLENSSVLQSPSSEKDAEIKGAEMSSGERWLKLEAEVSRIYFFRFMWLLLSQSAHFRNSK